MLEAKPPPKNLFCNFKKDFRSILFFLHDEMHTSIPILPCYVLQSDLTKTSHPACLINLAMLKNKRAHPVLNLTLSCKLVSRSGLFQSFPKLTPPRKPKKNTNMSLFLPPVPLSTLPTLPTCHGSTSALWGLGNHTCIILCFLIDRSFSFVESLDNKSILKFSSS